MVEGGSMRKVGSAKTGLKKLEKVGFGYGGLLKCQVSEDLSLLYSKR